jgi:hypothetical protein
MRERATTIEMNQIRFAPEWKSFEERKLCHLVCRAKLMAELEWYWFAYNGIIEVGKRTGYE